MSDLSSKEQVELAFDAWWRDLTRRGDPARRPHLTSEAFVAGWEAAHSDSDEIKHLRQELAKSQDAVDYYYALAKRGAAHEPAVALLEASQRVSAIALDAAGKHAERVVELENEVSTLREHLAEQNRLLSLNVAEVERLRASQPPPESPLAKVACCFAGKVKDSYILKLWFQSQEDLDAAFDLVDDVATMLPMVPMDSPAGERDE